MENNEEYEIDLMKLAKALWHKAWIVVIAAVVLGVIVFLYTYFLVTPLYESSTLIYVNNSSISVGSASVSISSSDLTAAKTLVDTYVVILKSRTMLNRVINQSGVDYTYEELYNMISAGAVNSTEIFEVTVTDEDPEEAELIANTIAILLPDVISNVVEGSSVRIVDYAVVPSTRSSPSYTRNTLLGVIVGAVLSCIIIVCMELFDETIRSEDYLTQTYPDIPLLAVIPDFESHSGGSYGYYYSYGYGNSRKSSKSGKESVK